MNEELVRAVLERRVVVFLYEGLLRTVEPHAYGLSAAGHELLSGYLTAGFSFSSEQPGWRLFRVERIADFAPTPYTFSTPRPGYNPRHTLLTHVFAQVMESPAPEHEAPALH